MVHIEVFFGHLNASGSGVDRTEALVFEEFEQVDLFLGFLGRDRTQEFSEAEGLNEVFDFGYVFIARDSGLDFGVQIGLRERVLAWGGLSIDEFLDRAQIVGDQELVF
jgi:hypothetical protein